MAKKVQIKKVKKPAKQSPKTSMATFRAKKIGLIEGGRAGVSSLVAKIRAARLEG